MPWRNCVNQAIATGLSRDPDDDDSFRVYVGILCFFNGVIEVISRGAYVLLKPAAAVPLAADQQATPSSKGHSSSIGGGSGSGIGSNPHHIVGNGTEGIVAGLCRSDAAAGIVSSIDMKNGICEVILLSRNLESDAADGESGRTVGDATTSRKGSRPARHTLTVRALRSPALGRSAGTRSPLSFG